MMKRSIFAVVLMLALALVAANSRADGIVPVGRGSYTTSLPRGAKGPPTAIFKTDRVTGPMPTNDWWSSLAWERYSFSHYPHPMAVIAEKNGLGVSYPGPGIHSTEAAIFGFLANAAGADLTLGHSRQDEFPDARVDGFSDWFVDVMFAAQADELRVSYGHGSPMVYALLKGGSAKITFPSIPKVWAGGANDPVLGVTIRGRSYALFGPTGSRWSGIGGDTLVNETDKPYFSLALLPEESETALTLFRRYAYAHVTGTRIRGAYDPDSASVTTQFQFTVHPYEGSETGTVFSLYPHQWRYLQNDAAASKQTGFQYASVRGAMKLRTGDHFSTRAAFPGVLPSLPAVGGYDRARLRQYLAEESDRAAGSSALKDTYWGGKDLGKWATLIPIAEQLGEDKIVSTLRDRLRANLEAWLSAKPEDEAGLFYYDRNWGTLIGYPASFGSGDQLNDHHFHYGYFIKAAAELARHDPTWADDDNWGGMVKLLVRDVAEIQRDDRRFPFLRCFDPYAGHSWASGHARFADGNNNESSSEAMNAWCGLILLGEAIGDKQLRDLGAWLYTTEMTAIEEYWFDVRDENHPADYTPSVVTMVWGGKGANGTWFSGNPELVHGINWLPIHGGSLYLGRYPDYVNKNYAALLRENKGSSWDEWADLVIMYLALANPAEALRQFDATHGTYKGEGGNSKANTYLWLHALAALGHVDRHTTADYPLSAVFRKQGQATYVVYNMAGRPLKVSFSDGVTIDAGKKGFSTHRVE